jgi:hypothetical protein
MQPLVASSVVKLCVLDWFGAQGSFFCVMMWLCLLGDGSNVGCWVDWILRWIVGKSQMEDVWIIEVDDLQFHFQVIGVDVSF